MVVKRFVLAMSGLYILLSFTLPIDRPFNTAWHSTTLPDGLMSLLSSIYMAISLIAFCILAVARKYPKVADKLNAVTKPIYVYTAGLLGLLLMLELNIARVPGLWFSWNTLGLQISTILVIYVLTKDKLQTHESILAGVGVACIAMGLWEIPYQWGMVIKTYPQDMVASKVYYETLLQLPLIIGGVAILYALNKRYHLLKLNGITTAFILLTVALYAGWFISGFQLDVYYDWNTGQYVNNPNDYMTMLLHRGSKATLAVGLIGLYKRE